jgi:hypothetical protein
MPDNLEKLMCPGTEAVRSYEVLSWAEMVWCQRSIGQLRPEQVGLLRIWL